MELLFRYELQKLQTMNIKITEQSGVYTLISEQIISAPLQEVWEFFTHPKNLDSITPSDMKFTITNNPGDKTYSGQIITYQIGILPLVRSNWITEITHLVDKKFFVDEQRFGPYSLWHHEHHFEELSDGKVKMTDIVNYKLPLGILGKLFAGNSIKIRLISIFSYRFLKIEKLFA